MTKEYSKILVSDFFEKILHMYHDAILTLLSTEKCKCKMCGKLLEKVNEKLISAHLMRKCFNNLTYSSFTVGYVRETEGEPGN